MVNDETRYGESTFIIYYFIKYRMKIFYTLLILLLTTLTYAQSYNVTGKIVDENDDNVIGANVILGNATDSLFKAISTDQYGNFKLENVPQGSYKLKVSYIGFKTFSQEVFVRGNIGLGKITIETDNVQLSEVEIVEQILTVVQKEDTTEINADAFKTNPDATAEDLLKKMPGVTSTNGKISAQGEVITEVLVDGRPFFGNDPNAALKTLPAEVIAKIQIYDKESEQSQLTGVSDGQTTKTINIITKSNMRSGEFGKIYAGYGYDNKYAAGGNMNFFKNARRVSIIAQTNNVNQQNFSNDDLLGVMGSGGGGRRGGGGGSSGDFLVNAQNGISTTHAFGVNYSDKWGEKVDVSGSYFFNLSDNNSKQNLTRTFLSDANDFDQTYSETDSSKSRNINHRINLKLDYKIDEYKNLTIEPRLTIQQNAGSQTIFGQNIASSLLLNSTDYNFASDLTAIDFNGRVSYRQRFEKKGRSFSISLNSGYNENTGNSDLLSRNNYFTNVSLSDTLDQNADLNNDGWEASARVMYTEPLGEKAVIYADYNASIQRTNADKKTYDFEEATQSYSALNSTLSNEFVSDYLTQKAGLGVRFGDRGKMMVVAGLGVQWSELTNELVYPTADNISRTFVNLIPFAMVRKNFSKSENLRFFYRVNTNPPSISQLQNVINNSNPLKLQTGNADLEQQVQHRLSLRYNKTNTENSSIFYATISADLRENYIGNSTFVARQDTLLADGIVLGRGGQLIMPVNLKGYFNINGFVTYGFPIKPLKTNLNFNISAGYNTQPGLISGIENFSNTATAGIGITLSSNISEKIDFTLTSMSNMNQSTNTASGFATTQYFNQMSTGSLNLILGEKWVFQTDLVHNYYSGLSDGFNQNYFLWNMSLGRKFLKDNRGDLRFKVYDLLNQNTSISRNVTPAYIEDVQTVVLQRYIMAIFTYDIRNFGEAPKEEEGSRRGRGEW
jgi:hypothetical protein